MGVQGLWELLAPVGRRVSVETLAGKKLAIDASIWMIQFMKAMRDEKGEMVRNAHLIGFFRRICKLLFLRTKPVFVFDGGTPALKRRTVIARRRQRENAQAKIRKTAEKLLLNHLKAMKLKELAENLESQTQNKDLKGKRILSDQTEAYADAGSYNQEALDELLAASLAAEEDGSLTSKASTSFCGNSPEEAHDSDDEEMILPVMHGKLDPAVLAALPPSMQLDLLVQMRERLMAENRQKYQKVKKAPAEFSELQIQAYLKTVAFRREIDEVQKSAAGRGVGGVQTSRIASEANREFIFSSSFTGDKQILASSGADKNGDAQQCQSLQNEPSSDSLNCITSTVHSNLAAVSEIDETRRDSDDGVETYLDERGRVRVSRLRAMGIRMTRDLQMNLDIMKEINQVKIKENTSVDTDAIFNKEEPGGFLGNNRFLETSGGDKGEHEIMSSNNGMNMSLQGENDQTNEYFIFRNGSTMEISFIEDESGQKNADGEEDLFAHLVAGDSEMVFPSENTPGKRLLTHASDCDLEEKIMEGKSDGFCDDGNRESQPSIAGSNVSDGSEVEWEEGICDVIRHASPCPPDTEKSVSIGCLEEEADLQEAIRRSLEDSEGNKSIGMSSENENFSISGEMVYRDTTTGFTHQASNLEKYKFGTPNNTLFELLAGDENMDTIGNTQKISGSPERLLVSSMANDTVEVLIDKPSEGCTVSASGCLRDNTSKYDTVETETSHLELVPPIDAKEVNLGNQRLDICNEDGEVSGISISSSGVAPISAAVMTDMLDSALVDAHHQNNNEALATSLSNKTSYHDISCEKYSTKEAFDTEIEQTPDRGKTCDIFSEEREQMGKFEMKDNMEVQVEESEALLKEEMLNLSQERVTLGYERRKLERNAESVSSEMFAECQELLQMFGLPYIIAPMEAEAQCAYMEIAGLVDGVVTDDSDVFLFGARSVYKNIFDDRKYVETYFMKDIESELGLTREKLIRMAMLLGSDYTEGVSGIGIVNAIEVVNAFPEENGLQKFREWLESPDPSILGKLDVQTGSSRKRGSKVGKDDLNTGGSGCDGNFFECHDDIPNVKQIFMEKHRNVSKNWHIPSSFPSETVISAYTSPQVDKSTEPFSWGKPDLFMLHRLCWEKFGWGNQKADELLVPVLKEYNKHETQLRLESFYTFNERFAKIRSHRIKKAVKGITGKRSLELMDDLPEAVSGAKERRMLSPGRTEKNKLESPLFGKDSQAGNEMSVSEKATPNVLRSLRKKKKHVPSEMGDSEPSIPEKGGRKIKRDSVEHVRVRGRGRGRGRGKAVGRTKYPHLESAEISSNDDNNDSDDQKIDVGKTEEFSEVRRSTRPRKPVNYMVNDEEFDGISEILDRSAGKGANGGTAQEESSCEKEMFHDANLGFSEQNRPSDGNPSIVDGDDEDYLELGGGFCIDGEQEHGTINEVPSVPSSRGAMYHNSNASFEAELSSDYLKDGGGFCLDEGEPDTHPVLYVSTFAGPSGHDGANPSHPSMEAVSGESLKAGEFQMDERELDDGSVQSICCQRPHDGLSKRKDNVDTERSVHCPNDRDDNDATSTGGLLQDNPPELGENDSVASSTRLTAMPFLRRKRKKS